MNKNNASAVAITGAGIICSTATDCEEFSAALKNGNTGIDFFSENDGTSDIKYIGAIIKKLDLNQLLTKYNKLPKSLIRKGKSLVHHAPLAIQLTVCSAFEAWQQAKLYQIKMDTSRIGIIVAGSNLTGSYQYDHYMKYKEKPLYLTPRYAYSFLDTNCVGVLSELFSIHGEGFTTGGASASGNVALIKAMQLIHYGTVDVCLVAGPPAILSPMELQGFINIGAMGGRTFRDVPQQACRPFDSCHEGFIYGQATACLILESKKSANNRDVPILAHLLSGVIKLAANSSVSPDVDFESQSMVEAMAQAGIHYSEIDYINAHGTSSPLGDKTEVAAFRNIFKNHLPNIWINSTKGLIGHCLHSAGIVEAIATIIQMNNHFIHPNNNLENPIDKECRFTGDKAVKSNIKYGLSNSFGFGGINTSIILENVNIKGNERV